MKDKNCCLDKSYFTDLWGVKQSDNFGHKICPQEPHNKSSLNNECHIAKLGLLGLLKRC